MKLFSYLTMVLLPADFTAVSAPDPTTKMWYDLNFLRLQEAFGINVAETGNGSKPKLWAYVATAVPFTLLTVWIVGALQLPYMTDDVNATAAKERNQEGFTWFSRLLWPITLIRTSLSDKAKNRRLRGLGYEYHHSE